MQFHSSTVPIFPLNTSTSLFSHQMLTESTSSKYSTFLSNSLAVTKAKAQEIERSRLQHYSITQTPPIPPRKKIIKIYTSPLLKTPISPKRGLLVSTTSTITLAVPGNSGGPESSVIFTESKISSACNLKFTSLEAANSS